MDTKIVFVATLDTKLTIQEINKAIKTIEKHPSLQQIRLQIDVDNSVTNTLRQFSNTFKELETTARRAQRSLNDVTKEVRNYSNAIKEVQAPELGASQNGLDNVEANLQNTSASAKTTEVFLTSLGDELKSTFSGDIFSQISGELKGNITLLDNTLTNVDRLTAAYQRASRSSSMLGVNLAGLRNAMIVARLSSIALQTTLSMGLSLVITGIVTGLTALAQKYQEQKRIEKEYAEQQKQIAVNYINNKDQINELIMSYTRLQKATLGGIFFSNLEQEQQYKETIEQLSELMPSLLSSVDAKGNKHLKNAEAIKEELEYAQKLSEIEQSEQVLDAESNFEKQVKALDKLEDKTLSLQALQARGGTISGHGAYIPYSESDLNQMEFKITTLQKNIAASSNLIREDLNKLINNVLDLNEIEVDDHLSGQINSIVSSLDVSDMNGEELEQAGHQIASLITNLSSINTARSIQELQYLEQNIVNIGNKLGISEDKARKMIQAFVDASNTTSFENTLSSINAVNQKIDASIQTISSLSSSYETLASGEQLSANRVLELVQQYPLLANHLMKTNDLTFNKGELLKEVAEIERATRVKELQNAIDSVEETRNELQQKQDLYKQYYDNIVQSGGPIDAWMLGSALTEDEKKKLEVYNKQLEEMKTRLLLLNQPIEIKEKNKGGSSARSTVKDEARQQDATQSRINAYNALADAQNKLNEALETNISADDAYSVRIQKTTDLIKGQQKEIENLEKANKNLQSERNKLDINSSHDLTKWVDANGEATEAYYKLFNGMSTGTSQKSLQKIFDQYQQYTKAIISNKETIDSIIPGQKELYNSIDEIKLERTEMHLSKLTDSLSRYDEWMSQSKKTLSLLTEGSAEYNAEVQKQVQLLGAQQNEILANITWAEERLKQGDLTKDQIRAITASLKEQQSMLLDVTVSQYEYNKNWQEGVKQTVNKSIELIEQYYKKQEELEKNSLDRHLDAYEDYIGARKKLLSRQDDQEDFQKNREALQKEELELRSQIDRLMLDNSWEAISKREDLEKQLNAKLEEIADMELDYNRKQRDNNYDDLLEAKQIEIKEAKDKVELKWQNEINADSYYGALKQSLLEGNVEKMRSALENFSLNIQTYMDQIGNSIDMNLIDKLDLQDRFSNLNDSIKNVQNSQPSKSAATQYDSAALSAWNEYVENKRQAELLGASSPKFQELKQQNEQLRSQYHFVDSSYAALSNSPLPIFSTDPTLQTAWNQYLQNKKKAEEIGTPSSPEFQRLKKENEEFRSKYNFADSSYAELSKYSSPIFSARSGGMTPQWGDEGKFGILHENELIMNKVQTKDILRVNEWTQNLIGQLKSIDLSSMIRPASLTAATTNNNYDFTFHLTGTATRSDADLFVKAFQDFTRKR